MTASSRARPARIAVDLLGGDNAPAVVVDGALRAIGADPDLRLHLVGPPAAVDEVVSGCPPADRDRLTACPVSGGVGSLDVPTWAARPDTTVRAGVAEVAAGRADVLVSAGVSGAVVTAAVVGLGRTPGVRRPALAVILPTPGGPLVLLDVGAGTDAPAGLLVRHAELGAGYARRVLGSTLPRVGLLSVGTERGKGDRVRRAADELLRERPGLRYVGNVEGHDVPLGGRADVVVTDGFTGNVLLKGIEGAMALAGWPEPAGAAARGAALLGVRGDVVVCHGAATGTHIASAIALATRLAQEDHPERGRLPDPGVTIVRSR